MMVAATVAPKSDAPDDDAPDFHVPSMILVSQSEAKAPMSNLLASTGGSVRYGLGVSTGGPTGFCSWRLMLRIHTLSSV